jgi:hypothetical protein
MYISDDFFLKKLLVSCQNVTDVFFLRASDVSAMNCALCA